MDLLYCWFFSVPSQQAGHEPPLGLRGVIFPGTGSQGHGERECLAPVLMSPQENTPHTVLQGKDRRSALQAGENRAGSLASSGLTFQLISLWEAGRDLLISTAQARLAAGSGGTRLCFSGLEQSARSRQAQTRVSRISERFKIH